jgi:hypothetical protein
MIFGRDYKLHVGDIDLSNLDIQFKVKKSIKVEPNTCDIHIFGLAEETRNRIQNYGKAGEVPVLLEAGYKGATSQLYLGELRYAATTYDGAETVTQIATDDGARKIQKTRLAVSLGPGATAVQAFDAVVKALGLKPGNTQKARALFVASGVADIYQQGTAIAGSAADALSDLCASANCEWSVQGGHIQILSRGAALIGKAVVLSADSGLVGSPKLATDGTVEAVCLLIPELRPGCIVDIQSRAVRGAYRVELIEYDGDTSGEPWYAKIHGKKY